MGAMIPENPVVGGTVLQRAAIRSPNFVTGSTGWSVNQDGSAEFNNITIRNGQIISGIALFYSGAPALGNLVESIAAVGGTDAKGNLYLSGTASYAGGGTLALAIQGNIINFFAAPGPGGPWTQVAQISPGSGDLIFASNRHIVSQQEIVGQAGLVVSGGATDSLALTGNAAAAAILSITDTVANTSPLIQAIVAAATPHLFFGGEVTGDTNNRIALRTDASGNPQITLGTGAAVGDTIMQRNASADMVLNPGRAVQVQAAVALNNIAAPAAIAGNTQVFSDSNGKLAQLPPAGTVMQVPGNGLATYPATTVTSATFATLGTMTIPANDAEVGSCYELEVEGTFTQATTTAVTLSLAVALGGTTDSNQTIAATYAPAGGTGRFRARVRAYCVTTGAAGTWRTSILAEVCQNATPGSIVILDSTFTTLLTKDTTVAQALVLQAKQGAITNSPSIVNREQIAKRVA